MNVKFKQGDNTLGVLLLFIIVPGHKLRGSLALCSIGDWLKMKPNFEDSNDVNDMVY